ncbi:MAG: hypothetical protein JXB88_06680, partial [Spirochaetales bacterium]|nr:hypothetical protein [Spirochaetales bacterium]
LGGDSIKAIQVSTRAKSAGYKLEIGQLFDHPTIESVEKYITIQDTQHDQSKVSGPVLLTPGQKWFLYHIKSVKHHFNLSNLLTIKGKFDEKVFHNVCREIMEHHDTLRMIFKNENGKYIQENKLEMDAYARVYDLSQGDDYKKEMKEITDNAQVDFELGSGPLIKFICFKLPGVTQLLIVANHLIFDLVSFRILLEDLESGYKQAKNGKEIKLPPKTDSYKKWGESLGHYYKSAEFKKISSYWLKKEEIGIDELPQKNSNSNNIYASSQSIFSIEDTTRLLTNTIRVFNTKIDVVLLAALSRAISVWCGARHICIDLDSHGRNNGFMGLDISRTIGWFNTQYPVIVDLTQNPGINDLISIVHNELNSIPNMGIDYGLLQYGIGDMNGNPALMRKDPLISFNYLGQFDTDLETELFGMGNDFIYNSIDPNLMLEQNLIFFCIIVKGFFSMSISSLKYNQQTLDNLISLYETAIKEIIYNDSSIQK